MRMKRIIAMSLLLAGCAGSGVPAGNERASAKVHTELAGLYYERAQMGIALSEIELALRADSGYAPIYNVRALVHMALREDEAAEDDFRRGLSLDKTDAEMHNNYGWFLCQRDRVKESLPHFMAAIKNPLYETPERAYVNAGLCSQKAGNSKDAEDFFQRALQLRPGLPQALVGLAELSFANGNYAAAKRHFSNLAGNTDGLTAENLWLAVRIERKVGDRNSEASYAKQLSNRYPDSKEARFLTGK